MGEPGQNIKIGAVTIGQSPRVDVTPEFEAALGINAELVQAGALDGLSPEETRQFAPQGGECFLVTRMRDGTEVRVAERHIHRRVQDCVRGLEAASVDLIVLFCTGEFPRLDSRCLILKPDVLMKHLIPGILPQGRLGIVLPAPEQAAAMKKKWQSTGLEMVFDAASPYTGTAADFRAAARRLAAGKVDLIVPDCIGFTGEMKRILREESGKPVILPRTLLGRVCGELLDARGGRPW
ncbi:MAG: AroM family protein [Spirochaetaceae bacterium]|jgi:protein AroM|nr:AroM family protein [Spirochaetaceae bacterium]